MSKKAFTLIELLATIIILGVIGLIVYPTLNKVISGNKDKAFQKQVEEVERIASHWVANNINDVYYENNKSKYLYLSELYETGFIDKDKVYNPKTNEEMRGCVVITWKSDINQYTYTYDEECSPTEPPVIAMNVDSNIINSKGWSKENFYVKVKGEYLTSYNYCVSELDCTPTTTVTGTSGSIYITKEGTNRVCVEGINKTGKTETKCESYKLDKTVPVIGNILVNGTMGLNNWYVSNVIVSKTESRDTLSGIESNELSPSITNITSDTTGTEYTLTAKDNAGNVSTRSHSFKVDKTKPVVGSANVSGTMGLNNWYRSDVTITPANGSDTTSGHSSTTVSKSSITTETSGTEVIVTTKDQAGNTSTRSYTIKIDKTPPTVGTANIAGTLGSNSWYTSNVTITPVIGSDATSGHSGTSVSPNSITSNTSGETILITTTDVASNSTTKTYTVKVDKNSPTLSAKDGVVEIIEGDNNPVSNYFNQPTYSISGGNISCSPINTSSLAVGQQTVTCTATGNNGLTTITNKTITVKPDVYTDGSGANDPDLLTNMIPIKYDGTNWVYADINQEWYNYNNKQWANAIILNSGVTKSVGQTILETEIALWYVWIPRYKYTIFNGNNESKPEQVIDVTFETETITTGTISCTTATSGSDTGKSEDCTDTTNGNIINGTSTHTHPAFTFGTDSLRGIWVGKFEVSTTNSNCLSNPSESSCNKIHIIKTVPNVSSLRYVRVSRFFTSIKNIEADYGIRNGDSHMIKNMEWGATAYLKQSKYGLGTTDIGINNNYGYRTGCGAPANSPYSYSCSTYNTVHGVLASTTGNIYGVYDMSGGTDEVVMGNMVNTSNEFNSGSADFATTPDTKYYDSYTYSDSQLTHNRGRLGDATKETLAIYGNTDGGWAGDRTNFISASNSWFFRGFYYKADSVAGVFTFTNSIFFANDSGSTRAVLVAK